MASCYILYKAIIQVDAVEEQLTMGVLQSMFTLPVWSHFFYFPSNIDVIKQMTWNLSSIKILAQSEAECSVSAQCKKKAVHNLYRMRCGSLKLIRKSYIKHFPTLIYTLPIYSTIALLHQWKTSATNTKQTRAEPWTAPLGSLRLVKRSILIGMRTHNLHLAAYFQCSSTVGAFVNTAWSNYC